MGGGIGGLLLLALLLPARSLRLLMCSHDAKPPSSSLRERRRDRRLSCAVVSPSPAPLPEKTEELVPANEQAACFDVLALSELGSPLEAIEGPHLTLLGWADLFPGSGLDEAFHSSAAFRTALRRAAREDFVRPLALSESVKRSMVTDDAVSVQSSWRTANDFPSLSRVLLAHGVDLTGPALVAGLSSLCGDSEHVFGSWIDIVGVRGRRVAHSWHQDSGLAQRTVMVGFPPCDGFEGPGVFSHAVKLTHRLPPPLTPGPRLWQGGFAAELVVRPWFRRGAEVMVYDDRDLFHSAPDFARRESIWRLM